MLSRFSHVRLFATPWTVPARLLCPWDSPGKNTGVGPGIEHGSPELQAVSLPSELPGKLFESDYLSLKHTNKISKLQ